MFVAKRIAISKEQMCYADITILMKICFEVVIIKDLYVWENDVLD